MKFRLEFIFFSFTYECQLLQHRLLKMQCSECLLYLCQKKVRNICVLMTFYFLIPNHILKSRNMACHSLNSPYALWDGAHALHPFCSSLPTLKLTLNVDSVNHSFLLDSYTTLNHLLLSLTCFLFLVYCKFLEKFKENEEKTLSS